jgi:DNA-binding XRE family transcriptional regulator
MSQRKLAEASDVSKKTLANVEAGRGHALPSTAHKMGAAFALRPLRVARDPR